MTNHIGDTNGMVNKRMEDEGDITAISPKLYSALRSTGGKPGRPKGYDGTKTKQPSAIAKAFKKVGLDWKEDFAKAIMANDRERIQLWLKLLPYLITTGKRAKVRSWKGKPSKAAQLALEAMEQEL